MNAQPETNPNDYVNDIVNKYMGFLGQGAGHSKGIAFLELGSEFKFEQVQKNLHIFEKLMPWIANHFDKSHPLNLSSLLNQIDSDDRRVILVEYLTVLDTNPVIFQLLSKQGWARPEDVEATTNTKNRRRLMFSIDQTKIAETRERVAAILENNKELYKQMEDKYADIGRDQVVLCIPYKDSEMCVRFLNPSLRPVAKDEDAAKIEQERIDDIRSFQIMLRPLQSGEGTDFLTFSITLSANGVLRRDGNDGFLFLAPPGGGIIDEARLFEIIANRNENEMKADLEACLEKYLFED